MAIYTEKLPLLCKDPASDKYSGYCTKNKLGSENSLLRFYIYSTLHIGLL